MNSPANGAHGGPAKGIAPDLERRVGLVVDTLARWLALAGGLVLIALTVMSVISIVGRSLVGVSDFWPLSVMGPVTGDFELVEAGCAFAVFAFLPWCQMRRGHVTVDVFVSALGPRARAALTLAGNILLAVTAVLIAWRLWLGMLDKKAYSETTFILQMPSWWGYAAAMVGAVMFAVVSAYTIWRSLNEMLGDGERA
ncbi:TRAP transporter small permease [Breoghania sp. L-A4]|uniref:TRAP transporter small permease n=1 Tax=Breoghania sp. L-A4 TaxID=2304600 RepID=UPI000E35E0A0|nr:TRAP transporter small permease [Breoghania sp. L-A4]AXS40339.1 TRAP transporter small permease [Breoghania sp. L-A4]